ncbi:secretin N-terminal domain-containing protein [Pelagicoccus sp. SDUM812003]|uniref:secretin N-terminal domain-containing protein n=1 Tax=Pelagicoccus sp. SDUM812003 TaxID=3041267 RepID=UPI0028106389|nr:secretin N-terminal domain-containing protein [Pelagicoccus sp. SDUM812003]MDQ8202966.1 secretin N-terminal domain-containing protein [Pelagicoccus sp. SDUM812003]
MRIRKPNTTLFAAVPLLLALAGATLFAQQQSPSGLTAPDPDAIIDDYKIIGQNIEGVLEILSQLTGRSILRPQALPTPEITFDSGGPITTGELILALETLLSLNDIGIAPHGDRFLKVVPINEIRTEAPELVTESLSQRSPSGQVVSKLFRLQHLDSQTFQQQIQPFLSPGFSSIIPFKNSNAVIVTDTISNLQRLEYVVGEVDKPSRLNVEPFFYTLQFAQAAEVAQQIQQMIDDARNRFGDQTGGSGNSGNRRNASNNTATDVAPPPPSGDGEGSISQILFGSNTAISSDDRTNQIIIMTAPSNLEFFEGIIQKLDVKADPSTRIDVIPLKHADAAEVASLLSQFVSGKTKQDSSDRSNSSQRSSNRRIGGNTPTFPSAEEPVTQSPRENAISNVLNTSEERDSQFSNFMTILADERSNSLVISGTRNDLELMNALVDRIDVLLPQVRIEVIIADVSLNRRKGLNRGMDAFSVSFEEQEDGSGDYTFPGVNFLGLGLEGSFNYNDGVYSNLTIDAVLNQARTNSDVELLSVPTLVTTHNKEATIIEAKSYPIITSSQTSTISDSVRQSVQYQNIGIEMTVTPLIGPNDVIQLEIDQTIDDIADFVQIGDDSQPIISKRQATSYVSVANGELVVLGGLQRNRVQTDKARAHLLGNIPLLGKLFRTRQVDNQKSELMVFIRPQIIRTTDEVNFDAQRKLDSLKTQESLNRFLETGELEVEVSEEEQEGSRPKTKGARN